jgi:large subunit ribosomal protein L4e
MSKGHIIQETAEFPLVVSDKIQEYDKTKQAIVFLRKLKIWKDVAKVYKSQRNRAGVGKMRNRRRVQRKGPLIVYAKDQGVSRAFRNIPGVETADVSKLNLLKLAPGGHVGRFVIWTESAFKELDKLYGTWRTGSTSKKNYNLPMPKMANTDLARLLRSDEIQKVIRDPIKVRTLRRAKQNPLKNQRAMVRLNPYAIVSKRAAIVREERVRSNKDQRTVALLARRKDMISKSRKALSAKVSKGGDARLKARIDKFSKRAAKKKEQRKKNAQLAGQKKKATPPLVASGTKKTVVVVAAKKATPTKK